MDERNSEAADPLQAILEISEIGVVSTLPETKEIVLSLVSP